MSGINNHHTDADDSIVDNFDPLILDNRFTTTNGTNGTGTATMMMSTPLPTFDAEKKKKPRKKRRSNVTKKPPDAPKRFKSSFIFFSMEKHKEIKARLASGGESEPNKATNITSLVSQAWRALETTERERFEAMAQEDKERYNIEKKNYVPPPGMSVTTKRKKDPDAPKRPMSAYLSYANKLRGKVKGENPDCSNGEISKILSGMWKEVPDDIRKNLKDEEKVRWDGYRIRMQEWRKNNDGRKKVMSALNVFGDMDRSSIAVGGKSRKKKEKLTIPDGEIDFSSSSHHHAMIDNDASVDDHLLGLGSVPGMDGNPNMTDEMMAALALRGVRGGPQQHLGENIMGDPSIANNSNSNGYGALFGVNGTNTLPGTAATSFGQIDMGFPYNQYNYNPLVGNSMIMAQLRGASNNPYQQYSGSIPMDQQPNLSQLASLAGVQNDASQEGMQQQTQDTRSNQFVSETGMNTATGNSIDDGNIGSPGRSPNSDGFAI